MSFSRILSKKLMPGKIQFTISDIIANAPKILDFIKDLNEGRLVDDIESQEFKKSNNLADRIDVHAELKPFLVDLLNDKKSGYEIRESIVQHRRLIHAMFYNKDYILTQLNEMIIELENQVVSEEERRGIGYNVVQRYDCTKIKRT